MSSNDVVKSVAKNLKYYFEVKRLEDGFDLSDTHQPQLDHPPLKVVGWSSQYDIDLRSALQGGMLRDKPLKHYFSHPEVRAKLTHLNRKNAREPLRSKREIQVRKLLENYMKNYCFQEDYHSVIPKKKTAVCKSTLPSSYCYHQSKGCPHGLYSAGGLRRRKKHRNLIGGWPLLRAVPDQHITKGEATRLVNSATKILAASEMLTLLRDLSVKDNSTSNMWQTNFGLYPGAVDYSLVKYDPSLYKKTQPKKQITAKYAPVYCPKEKKSNHKVIDDSDTDTDSSHRWSSHSRPQSPTPSSHTSRSTKSDGSSSSKSSTTVSNSSTEDSVSTSRPTSARFKSQSFISLPNTLPQEEVGIVQSTQTVDFFDEPLVDQNSIDKGEEELCHGPVSEYEVYVTTGNRLGASTKAPIKMIMYGEKGRTKEFVLEQSKRHKIPFQKGKEDLFVLSAHHIGQIKKIQIGHDRPELNYAWYLEGVTVYDMHAKRIFQFPCERWLSGQDGDKKTYRILEVDKERDFIEALDMSKSPRTPRNKDSSDSESSDILVNGRGRKKVNKTHDLEQKYRTDTSEVGRRGSDDVLYSPSAKNIYKTQPYVVQSKTIDEEKPNSGPVIRLHSAHDNKQVDEIFIGTHLIGKEKKQPQRHIVNDNKEENAQSEEGKRYQLERERAMERSMLQGKGIHDAVRAGDLERVKDLINQFNEMKDFKDSSGWTPIHLAAARGNIDILRWLVTSDADINAVTPSGQNAMHISAMHGHVNSMMVLQAMGCSITSLTLEKQSALHLAAKNGHLECVKWLVANRASITQEDSKGKTAYQLAEESNWDHCAEFLNVCMKELTNPKSSFYQLNRNGNHTARESATVSNETPRNMKEKYYSS